MAGDHGGVELCGREGHPEQFEENLSALMSISKVEETGETRVECEEARLRHNILEPLSTYLGE